MSKKQKVWLYVFLALFVIPEVLWSPAINYIYELSQMSTRDELSAFRNNFLTQGNYGFVWYGFVLLIELIGLVGISYLFFKFRSNSKAVLITLSVLGWILTIVVAIEFYLVSFVNISFP